MQTVTGFIIRNDVNLFYLFNRKLRCQVLSIFMRGITELGSTAFSIALPLFLLLSGKEFVRNLGIQVALTLALSQVFVQTIKRLVHRPRPYKTLEKAIAIKPPSCQYSFPSGHTCAAFSLGLVLAYCLPVFSTLFLSGALLVGISRVYLGFHYPTDVVAGFLISLLSFGGVNYLMMPMI